MFSALALSTVLLATSCGGGAPPRRPAPPAPQPTLAEQLPLPARICIVLALPTPLRSAFAPYLIHTEPKLKAEPVATAAAPKAGCPLCTNPAGIAPRHAMFGPQRSISSPAPRRPAATTAPATK